MTSMPITGKEFADEDAAVVAVLDTEGTPAIGPFVSERPVAGPGQRSPCDHSNTHVRVKPGKAVGGPASTPERRG
jgi:hypothetical protein